ncbi:response regulator transcription factor [bacterium]|nr:response regulator transcription factor [bacterium]MBU1852859.1 response regulator transcription factor [Candidatus Omnitrophota bacterium]
MGKILVIEDDPVILEGIVDNLEQEGYSVITAMDGKTGLNMALDSSLDCIILDVMLPKMNGLEICRELRERNVKRPILMLTVRSDEVDKVLGLEIGADDYLTKPFSIHELIARIHALLRRVKRQQTVRSLDTYSFGDVHIDFRKYRVKRGSRIYRLKARECEVLKYIIERKEEVVNRSDILRDVWNYKFALSSRSIDNYIVRLRKMIEKDPARPIHILNVRGVGYKFID